MKQSPQHNTVFLLADRCCECVCACACAINVCLGGAPHKRASVVAIENKSKAVNVEALKRYREAKEAEAKVNGSPGDKKSPPPPKVDLYK